jgi:acetyl esterase/lipase
MLQLCMRLAALFSVTGISLAPLPGTTREVSAASDAAVQFADSIGYRYAVQPNLTYSTASNVELKLDLYLPREAKGLVPLVMVFHGGGWIEGHKDGTALYLLPYLQMGFAVANVGYRLGRVAPAPAAVEDTRCALRWLSRHATDFKIDTSKIVLTGRSAGGHLALITGMLSTGNPFDRACATDDKTQWASGGEPPMEVAAIINYFGIADVEDLLGGANAKHYAIAWLGASPNREAVARSVSPIQYVRTGLPAIFTVHGDADLLVPYAHSTRLHAALTKAGIPNELVTIPGGGHGNFSVAEARRISAAVRAFLARQGIGPVSR